MTTAACKKSGRKHTPIVSGRQQRFFGAELGRKREGRKTRTKMTEEELSGHLKEWGRKKVAESNARKAK